MKCGQERWSVKTLADAEAVRVSSEAMDATISQLRSLTAPNDLHHLPDHRHDPVEFRRYRIHAVLVAYKQEADEDFHLVLADPSIPSLTIVAEIPSPNCMDSGYASVVGQEQGWLVSTFGNVKGLGRLKKLPVPVPVIVEGVGFFDFPHGQTGVAPNGIELHPVLSIKLETTTAYEIPVRCISRAELVHCHGEFEGCATNLTWIHGCEQLKVK